jgi:hypothetical protein
MPAYRVMEVGGQCRKALLCGKRRLRYPGVMTIAALALLDGALAGSSERYVPLYEAKMIHQFDHCWATYDGVDSRDATPPQVFNSPAEAP